MRKERVPPIIFCREFESLGLSAHADVPGVGTVRLGCETGLHPVNQQVKCAVLETEARKRTGDDLGDQRMRSLLESKLCGRAGDEH